MNSVSAYVCLFVDQGQLNKDIPITAFRFWVTSHNKNLQQNIIILKLLTLFGSRMCVCRCACFICVSTSRRVECVQPAVFMSGGDVKSDLPQERHVTI